MLRQQFIGCAEHFHHRVIPGIEGAALGRAELHDQEVKGRHLNQLTDQGGTHLALQQFLRRAHRQFQLLNIEVGDEGNTRQAEQERKQQPDGQEQLPAAA